MSRDASDQQSATRGMTPRGCTVYLYGLGLRPGRDYSIRFTDAHPRIGERRTTHAPRTRKEWEELRAKFARAR